MAQAQRSAIAAAFGRAPSPSAGLLLERGLIDSARPSGQKEPSAIATLLGRVAELQAGSLYAAAYQRWSVALANRSALCLRRAKVQGRAIVGLGGESVLETAITLHRAYGTPLIPGSALKGLTRRYAEALATTEPRFASRGTYHEVLFGHLGTAACLTYHDAWYIPESAPGDMPLAGDVITVHHPQYYTRSAGRRAPWDFDDPTPVSFVSARGAFLLAVEGPTLAWARVGLELLARALADVGVGAKTSSGYGRLTVEPDDLVATLRTAANPTAAQHHTVPAPTTSAPPASTEHPLVAVINAIPSSAIAGSVTNYHRQWQALTDEAARVQVGRALLAQVARIKDSRKWAASRPWVAEVQAYVDAQGAGEQG